MDRDNSLQYLQTPVGSKRPSPSPSDDDRAAKKSCTQPHVDNVDRNILHNKLPFHFDTDNSLIPQDLNRDYETQFYDGFESQFDRFTSGQLANASLDSMPREKYMLANAYVSVPCNVGEQPTSTLDTTEFLELSNLELPSFAEPSFESLPNQLDPMVLDGSYSQPWNDNRTDVLTGLDVYQNEQPVFRDAQTNQTFSQIPAASPLTQSIEICCDYDTCFGVVVAELTSSSALEVGAHSIPVDLKPFGGILLIQSQNSGTHVGILNNAGLFNALQQLHLKLDATVRISEIKNIKELGKSGKSGKSKTKKPALATAARGYSIRIILYGLRNDKMAIGQLLSDSGLFLQHPCATEIIPEVQYDNPHYLLRPGAEMPKLEHLHLDTEDDSFAQTEQGNEIRMGRFLQIFETAEADGGAMTALTTSPSPRLRSTLMSHQITALAMMLEKESGYVEQPMFPSLWRKERLSENNNTIYYRHAVTRSLEFRPIPAMGGILADDMGLGKTLSILALVCSSLDFDSPTIGHSKNTRHRGTLIVAPKSTIHSWEDQILQHIHEGQIRVETYHGPGREKHANQLRDADIVITTYQTLRSEWAASKKTSPLYSWKWLRVVLDEGKQIPVQTRNFSIITNLTASHHIRNRSNKAFQSVCELISRYRWCLTGTPIHNSLDDYGALLSFIRVFPFVEKSKFMSWIVQPMEEQHSLGVERLQGLIRATCLRRTKEKALSSDKLKLPPRSEHIHDVHLNPDDQVLYDTVRRWNLEIAAGLEKLPEKGLLAKGKGTNILLLINSLRLICDHGQQLLPEAMKRRMEENPNASIASFASEIQEAYHGSCSGCGEELDDNVARAHGQYSMCASCAMSEQESSNTKAKKNPGGRKGISSFKPASPEISSLTERHYQPSAKVLALLGNLEQERTAARKSCWVRMLDLIQQGLCNAQFGFQRIDGQTSLEGRRKAIQEFNDRPDCTVLLASIGSSAEGLNLTAASIVHLIEPHWNPMVEAQAVDRVYRIGQTQEVTVYRYIVPNSVETYVVQVQREKVQMINQAINMNGVTEADLESKRWKGMKEMLAWVDT